MVICCSICSADIPGHWVDDLDVIVSHVRVGIDRKIVERYDSGPDNQQSESEYTQAIVKREIDNPANHFCSTVCWNTSALATT